jgi:CubicO group peptidase (beta-lactamase class C family)
VHLQPLGSLAVGGAPVARDSLFRIASVSKPITAAATLVLVDEGLIGLDEPVDRLLPELAERRVLRRMDGPLDDTRAAERPITTRDLLTFTCGFGMVAELFRAETPWPVVAAANALDLGQFGPPDPERQPEPDTWIARLGSLPLLAQPGATWMRRCRRVALHRGRPARIRPNAARGRRARVVGGAGFLDDGASWGFGLSVLADGCYGWDGGFGTSFLVDPNRDLIVIVLTQRMFDSPDLPSVHRDIRSAAYAALA